MGTIIASSPYKTISSLTLEDGTTIETRKNIIQTEYIPGNVVSSGGYFMITIALSPADFKRLIKDDTYENTK